MPIFKGTHARKSTKGQIHLFESTMVLFVFFFIIIIGFSVYQNFQQGKLERTQEEFNQKQAVKIAQKVLFLPEISCSTNADIKFDCIEIQKLQGFQDQLRLNSRYYREVLGPSRASLEVVYSPYTMPPPFDTNTTIPLYDFSGNLDNSYAFLIPINLNDATTIPETAHFAWLKVEVFS